MFTMYSLCSLNAYLEGNMSFRENCLSRECCSTAGMLTMYFDTLCVYAYLADNRENFPKGSLQSAMLQYCTFPRFPHILWMQNDEKVKTQIFIIILELSRIEWWAKTNRRISLFKVLFFNLIPLFLAYFISVGILRYLIVQCTCYETRTNTAKLFPS